MKVTNALKNSNDPLGGHECVVTAVEESISKNGSPMVKFCFDIGEDSVFKYYFQNLSDCINSKRDYYSWPNEGTKYFVLDGFGAKYFKNFISKVEQVNDIKIDIPDVGEDFDLSQFVGLKIGGEFGFEEYEKDGEIKTSLSILNFRTLDELPYITGYLVKGLDGRLYDYEEYKKEKEDKYYE